MDFFESIKTCLRKYATFGGRAGRPEYWWFMLFVFLASAAASVVGEKADAVVTLVLLLPMLSAASRRLHDVGKSGWMQLIGVIPVIGWILMIVWLCQKSGPPNAYGEGPEIPKDDPLEIPPHV